MLQIRSCGCIYVPPKSLQTARLAEYDRGVIRPRSRDNNKITPSLWVLLEKCGSRSINSVIVGGAGVFGGELGLVFWGVFFKVNISMIVFHFVSSRTEAATGWSAEVKYWSTLTTRGGRDVAREEDGGRRWKRFVFLRRFLAGEASSCTETPLSPLSSPTNNGHVTRFSNTFCIKFEAWGAGGHGRAALRWVLCWTWSVQCAFITFF